VSKRVSIRGQFKAIETAPAYAFISSVDSRLGNNNNIIGINNNKVIAPPPETKLDIPNVYHIYDIVSKICESTQAISAAALEAALAEIRTEPLSQDIQDHLIRQLTEYAEATDDRMRNWHALGIFSYLQGIIDCGESLLNPIKKE